MFVGYMHLFLQVKSLIFAACPEDPLATEQRERRRAKLTDAKAPMESVEDFTPCFLMESSYDG